MTDIRSELDAIERSSWAARDSAISLPCAKASSATESAVMCETPDFLPWVSGPAQAKKIAKAAKKAVKAAKKSAPAAPYGVKADGTPRKRPRYSSQNAAT